MEFMEFLNFCREEVNKAYPSVSIEDLDNFWNGGMMEVQRVMFRDRKGTDLYQVTYNSIAEAAEVVKYVVASAE